VARRSKRNRTPRGRAQASPSLPPFPYPEGPRGFTLRWINNHQGANPDTFFATNGGKMEELGIAQLIRHLPTDLMQRTEWIDRHIVKGSPVNPPESWCATLWHGLHHGWMHHRERGISGFLTEQILLMGGIEEVNKLGGLILSVNPLPERRRVQQFPEPRVVLAVEPDGEFCRLLVTEYWGICAIGVAPERDMEAILGPVSVVVVGQVLVDGVPYGEGEIGSEDSLILIDPLTVLADLGPVTGADDTGLLLIAEGDVAKIYHPDDDDARRYMHSSQRGFLDLWEGRVPGFIGRIGSLKRRMEQAQAERARQDAKIPVNPQYMEALERQLETARFMRDRHPIATVSRQMGTPPHRVDFDTVIAEGLETATTHYWTGHMCDLLERSYPNLPEWWLRPNEVGPRRGYCWFSTPIPLVPGDPEKLRALMWMIDPETGDYMIVPFTVFDGPGADDYVVTFRTYHGVPRQVQLWRDGQALTDWLAEEERDDYRGAAYVAGTDPGTLLAQRLAWGRVFATAVAIMNQVLVKVEPYGADRPARKRIEKLRPPGLEPPAPIVRAVLLRRQYTVQRGHKDGAEHIDWRFQWKVTEHWRQQWYPSLQQHKWILILEHIKGPPNKPLKTPLPIKIVGR